jgi:hypothetical protein
VKKTEAIFKWRVGRDGGLSGETASLEKEDDADQELESSLESAYA